MTHRYSQAECQHVAHCLSVWEGLSRLPFRGTVACCCVIACVQAEAQPSKRLLRPSCLLMSVHPDVPLVVDSGDLSPRSSFLTCPWAGAGPGCTIPAGVLRGLGARSPWASLMLSATPPAAPADDSPVLTRIFTSRTKRSSVRAAHHCPWHTDIANVWAAEGDETRKDAFVIPGQASATVAPGVAGGAVRQQRLSGGILPVPGELVPKGIDRRTSRRGHCPDVGPSDRRPPPDSQQPQQAAEKRVRENGGLSQRLVEGVQYAW